jgi:hypothetical protein
MIAQRARHVFIMDRFTGLFLSANGYWTASLVEARDFGNTAQAVAHCLAHKVADAQIAIANEVQGTRNVTMASSDGFTATISGQLERLPIRLPFSHAIER